MKTLLVGCGGISQTWLKAIAQIPEIELLGLVDLDEALAKQRAQQFELELVTGSSLFDMLHKLKPDLVFDCTIPQAHYDVSLAALKAGCHVFGEKPMADSLTEAQQMVKAAKEAGKVYAVMQNRRYDPNIRSLKAFLASGVLGDITTVHADFFVGARFGGFRDHMKHILVKDMAIHTFDAARFLIEKDPEAVYCHEWNPKGSWYDQDASAIAIFEMTDGVLFNYRGSWCAEGLRTTWESEWRIIGTKGSVSWNGAEGFKAELIEDNSGFLSTYKPLTVHSHKATDFGAGHLGALQSFTHAMLEGKEPETICTDNIKSLAMVLGAVESSEKGARVPIKLSF
ncbi:MAG: Gfo/Idh/MocA family oxidoreductase [Trueperaceae bacterium]|nr:Gfo/Idh/MocA family oxidoreductase [Trueperaceae bacterium]